MERDQSLPKVEMMPYERFNEDDRTLSGSAKSRKSMQESDFGRFKIKFVVIAMLWTCVFAFFYLGLSDDDSQCIAPNYLDWFENQIPYLDNEDGGWEKVNMVDVAHRFHKCFGWALTISACQVAVGLCCRLWEGDLVSPVLFTLY